MAEPSRDGAASGPKPRAPAEPSDSGAARRTAILDAAAGVFLRYGFKKTSMDDLARAAGLSRQGLYLHFATKEALFKEALLQLVATTRAAGRAALARDDLDVEERLVSAFEAVHGQMIGQPGAEHMAELMETAAQLVGSVVDELDQGLVADVARVLRSAGVAARWKEAGIGAKDLAENLCAASAGVKHGVTTAAEYRERMRVAVRIVCRGGSR
jgi:AcrR family transcriptional regulator